MGQGFRVDLGALERAASGVTNTLDQVSAHRVGEGTAGQADYGHSRLAGTVADFCDRWQLGVTNLAKDGQEIVTRLNACVASYERVEESLHGEFSGILGSTSGPDPAPSS